MLSQSQSQSLSQSQLSDNRCHSHSHSQSRNHSDETVVQHCRRDLRQVAANAIERSSSTTTQKKVIYYILVWCSYLSLPFPRTPLARVCNNYNNYNDLPSRLFVFLLFLRFLFMCQTSFELIEFLALPSVQLICKCCCWCRRCCCCSIASRK